MSLPLIDPFEESDLLDDIARKIPRPTLAELLAKYGRDWEKECEDVMSDIATAKDRARAKADEINELFPDGPNLTWQDFIGAGPVSR